MRKFFLKLIFIFYFLNCANYNPSTLSKNKPQVKLNKIQLKILAGAKNQLTNPAQYTPGYFKIKYPGGDLPQNIGVCTDVIIRAFRNAGIDLQILVHRDMKNNFKLYPKLWGLKKCDSNIDHRRVPNLITFFKRKGKTLTTIVNKKTQAQWQPADIVIWTLPNGLLHGGIISDKKNSQNIPYVIHNLGYTAEEDCLLVFKIIGHYRYP